MWNGAVDAVTFLNQFNPIANGYEAYHGYRYGTDSFGNPTTSFDNALHVIGVIPFGSFESFGVKAAKTGIQYTKSSLSLGREVHTAYKAGLADGVTTFKEFTGIKGIRPDFVDFGTKTIYELKPFNPRGIQLGKKQLNNYREYPGTIWKTVLDHY